MASGRMQVGKDSVSFEEDGHWEFDHPRERKSRTTQNGLGFFICLFFFSFIIFAGAGGTSVGEQTQQDLEISGFRVHDVKFQNNKSFML